MFDLVVAVVYLPLFNVTNQPINWWLAAVIAQFDK
jgi:hypothetical protein